VCADYFSDTNTSTYAVPDSYSAAAVPGGELALVDGRARLHGHQSTSFKPFLGVSSSSAAGTGSLPPPPTHPRDLYSGDAGVGLRGCSGNSCYAVPDMSSVELARWTRDMDPPAVLEFPPDSLRFVDKLGQGPHGEVRATGSLPANLEDLEKSGNLKVVGGKVRENVFFPLCCSAVSVTDTR